MMIRKQSPVVARAAFTLMEMLVVVAILVVLAGAAVPIYLSYLDGARRDRARADIKMLEGAVEAFSIDNGDYPATWDPLLQPDPASGKRAVLLQENLKDPWGQYYQLDSQNRHPTTLRPRIWTQIPGGGAVIANWGQ